VNVNIPTLCHLDLHDINMVNQIATCRVCMVEVARRRSLVPACATLVEEGMEVHTNTVRAVKARRTVVELLLSNHPRDCLVCFRNTSCDLQNLAVELGIREVHYKGKKSDFFIDDSSYSLRRDPNKCVLCRRCLTMCDNVQTVGVYSAINRGFDTVISTAYEQPVIETNCTFCGQCASVCPTGALSAIDDTARVWAALHDPKKYVIVQAAPAIRVALGEVFHMPVGTIVTGKMVAALRRMGFDKVYDTDFAADMTVMEEAAELIRRLEGDGRLPILTSCCPAWVKFIEHEFPNLLDIPSTCMSPHEMFGAIAKTYMAEKLNIDPADLVVVSVMPCMAKKYEVARPELIDNGKHPNVDYVVSTREVARMIREAGIVFTELEDEEFDSVMGTSSGAGVIFGTSGGVIEAAIRTAAAWMDESIDKIDFSELRGMEGIREATVEVAGKSLKIGIANELGNARKLLEAVRDGTAEYHAIEIMACPSGCVGGGGQPYYGSDVGILNKRAAAIYEEDRSKPIRRSHENPEVIKIYEEFLEKPGSEKAHELLHTHYVKRPV
jgi:iron-only hydrogenase group A